ncbi:MAG: succinyl-diaminopimelate desuccinylase [Aestuariivirgaceae bacterium]|nr:succinyl-diaminopimelate desuccinylase [Aestuariivirgaceae bacterium]
MSCCVTDPVSLLQDLIRCPSVTPIEGDALSLLESVLAPAGFACVRLKFGEVDNLFARFGTGAPHFCFAGHTDVVPPGDVTSWKHPPFDAVIEDGIIHGRGACDMKGSVAAFAAAAVDFVKKPGFAGSVSFLITGDEEGPAVDGTVKVLEWMAANGQVPDHCLVGEPSCPDVFGDTIKIGRRGSISFKVEVKGRQGHAAYPEKADNPIPKLSRLMDRISQVELDSGNAHFGPSTLAITSFDVGNPAGNVIPEKATARFNIRYNTEQTPATLTRWLEAQIDAVRAELGGDFSFTASEGAEVFLTTPGRFADVVRQAVAQETNRVPVFSTTGGTSDARFIKDYCEVVEFGPINQTIHQTDERIPVAELQALTRTYARILESYFAS